MDDRVIKISRLARNNKDDLGEKNGCNQLGWGHNSSLCSLLVGCNFVTSLFLGAMFDMESSF